MKNKISSCLLGFGALLVFGGLVIAALVISLCSNNNGMASTKPKVSTEPKAGVVVKDEFNTANLDKTEYIADTKISYIGRYVDCKAGMTIYTHSNSIAVVSNSQINQDLIKEKCK
ncbi:hypothetical protein AMD27_16795 (plasmid) [Acinetobacter sp. TGL-Y2]|uniref:hypothetical protein n=1 Tax=Acinetobacter sp. TGL-Y2 TaxID=1407071 RepID=UPI0007A669D1|nr:hypothetical protein [Acinetobacter sp. TGL-Y2]AMW80574.1 hypothetical protein AMD27_16795 [Acinetobacter sp. TGL-Y2]